MKPHNRPDPRFDIDLAYGRQGEIQIADYLTWLANGNGRIEVKRKTFIDLVFYLETHCDHGRRGQYVPSGITITTADAWAFVLGDSGISIIAPTDLLRLMLDHASTRDSTCLRGDCPTRGKLINLAHLLYEYRKRQAK